MFVTGRFIDLARPMHAVSMRIPSVCVAVGIDNKHMLFQIDRNHVYCR